MKKFLLLALAVLAPFASAQMGSGYSSYSNYTSDGTNIYATAVVDGSISCNLVPPGYNCGVIRHTGKAIVTIDGVQTVTQGSPVSPNSYISVSGTGTKVKAQLGTAYSEGSSTQINCSVAGLIFLASQAALLSISDGAELLRNLSGPAGIPGSCITKANGQTLCDWEVVASCTNQPTYTAAGVTDAPPGEAAWWTEYWCLFYYDTVLACRPVQYTATKTWTIGPVFCPNPVPGQ